MTSAVLSTAEVGQSDAASPFTQLRAVKTASQMMRVSGSHATFGRVVRVQLPCERIDLVFEPPMFGLLLAGLATEFLQLGSLGGDIPSLLGEGAGTKFSINAPKCCLAYCSIVSALALGGGPNWFSG